MSYLLAIVVVYFSENSIQLVCCAHLLACRFFVDLQVQFANILYAPSCAYVCVCSFSWWKISANIMVKLSTVDLRTNANVFHSNSDMAIR